MDAERDFGNVNIFEFNMVFDVIFVWFSRVMTKMKHFHIIPDLNAAQNYLLLHQILPFLRQIF